MPTRVEAPPEYNSSFYDFEITIPCWCSGVEHTSKAPQLTVIILNIDDIVVDQSYQVHPTKN